MIGDITGNSDVMINCIFDRMAEFWITLEIVNAVRHHAKVAFSHADSAG